MSTQECGVQERGNMAKTKEAKGTGTTKQWTPFADAIDAWLYQKSAETRQRWSRARLAQALHIAPSTVQAWFAKGTYPDARSFHALVQVTGWTPERLLKLMPYDAIPRYVPDVWEFIREEGRKRWGYEADEFMVWLDEVRAAYEKMPKRMPASPSLVSPESPETIAAVEDAPVRSVEIDLFGGESKASDTAKRPRATAIR